MISTLKKIIKKETFSGQLLILAVLTALIISNTPLYKYYLLLLNLKFILTIGNFSAGNTLIDWVNNGLMTLFFLYLSLEIKNQFLNGDFNSFKKIGLSFFAAFGGAVMSCYVFYLFNYNNPIYLKGWAIPISTDSAFVLAILTFFGTKIPEAAKIFFIGFSLIDDSFSVLVLALFYSPNIEIIPILFSLLIILFLIILNINNIKSLKPYCIFGLILWAAIVESGLNPTFSGVILGLLIPNKIANTSPLKLLKKKINFFVLYITLPIFAFLNSQIPLEYMNIDSFKSTLTLGIIFGLFIGKPLGVFIATYPLIKMKILFLPKDTNWKLYFSLLSFCGIGFTLNIFIGSLAFSSEILRDQMRIGIFLGAIFSTFMGLLIFKIYEKSLYNK